jgi:hypothetical protein
MSVEYAVLGAILAGALYLFWTQKQRTNVTALLVMLALLNYALAAPGRRVEGDSEGMKVAPRWS